MSIKSYILVIVTWVSIVTQIVLTFAFQEKFYDVYDILALVILGWIFWGFSIIFGVVPIFYFRKKGGVSKKSSYVKTTKLVDTGLYSIVRHPQYLAGIFWSIALVFLSQHWIVDILFVPVVFTTYFDSLKANKNLIEKFGEEYENYMKKVPGLNVLWGIVKLVNRKTRKERSD